MLIFRKLYHENETNIILIEVPGIIHIRISPVSIMPVAGEK